MCSLQCLQGGLQALGSTSSRSTSRPGSAFLPPSHSSTHHQQQLQHEPYNVSFPPSLSSSFSSSQSRPARQVCVCVSLCVHEMFCLQAGGYFFLFGRHVHFLGWTPLRDHPPPNPPFQCPHPDKKGTNLLLLHPSAHSTRPET